MSEAWGVCRAIAPMTPTTWICISIIIIYTDQHGALVLQISGRRKKWTFLNHCVPLFVGHPVRIKGCCESPAALTCLEYPEHDEEGFYYDEGNRQGQRSKEPFVKSTVLAAPSDSSSRRVFFDTLSAMSS
ncbi:hypothetical protein SUGI_0909860 [Cryptomeria japonica]|nr:hypothetical protein SUGI_0909860 [Cryptomeria japonica]